MIEAKDVRAYLEAHKDEILALLKEVVEIQSGSYHVAGVNRVQDVFERELKSLGFTTQRFTEEGYGDHLLGRRLRSGCFKVLLDGHVDTVFPEDSIPTFSVDGDTCRGQGVMDMKGGVVTSLTALKCLHHLSTLNTLDLYFLTESDEEIGSPSARTVIEQLAKEIDLALVFEEAGKEYEIVIERRGVQSLELTVKGRAGHAGNVLEDRRSAIEELAHQICQLRKIAHEYYERGILFNVGKISGGFAVNAIAEDAECGIDIRYTDPTAFEEMMVRFEEALTTSLIPNTVISLRRVANLPSMQKTERSQQAAHLFQEIARECGREVRLQRRGGGSNANLWSKYGTSVLDGLGPIGGDDHSDREWMNIPSMFERIIQTTLFLQKLATLK